ncbi:hypothetical protein PQ472_01060 [Lacticaseibacillus pabuli]|uniref:DUF2812 domain-containing protein n=1 Tax=Lacticaseibacillus pabuli TaxID=3025672 RepID=A0ABY7WRX4_9LACO|nr:hypothetical protein [Lacticaseibacillus sp. KACC 23028]WDF82861.1 hypothetical protein PQ472_01060 [Lacticaseibacillus sp. KACC 23028]
MIRYRWIRDNLTKEEGYLQKMAQKGYILRRLKGGRYYFDRPDKNKKYFVRLVISTEKVDEPFGAKVVRYIPLTQKLWYNVIYSASEPVKLESDSKAVDMYHKQLLSTGTIQEWKGGFGMMFGIIIFVSQIVFGKNGGFMGSLPMRGLIGLIGAALVLCSIWGIFVGLTNSAGSIHHDDDTNRQNAR